MFFAASRHAATSSASRTSRSSASSSFVSVVMEVPRFGWRTTSFRPSSRRTASRAGPRPTPTLCATLRSRIRAPGVNSRWKIAPSSLATNSSTSVCDVSGLDRVHLPYLWISPRGEPINNPAFAEQHFTVFTSFLLTAFLLSPRISGLTSVNTFSNIVYALYDRSRGGAMWGTEILKKSLVCGLTMFATLALSVGGFTARAQLAGATLAGQVLDQSGSAVAAAKLVIKNNVTGEVRTGTTNAEGLYSVQSLQPGIYSG